MTLFGFAMGGAAWGLSSIPAPSFVVSVDQASAFANDGHGQWRASVVPQSDRDRLVAQLDRKQELTLEPRGRGGVIASLDDLTPGYHFVEATVFRRGGRVDRVVDVVAAGPFQSEGDRGCDVALALSPDAVETLLLPALKHKVVAGAQSQDEFFGATSFVASSELELVEGGLSFVVALDTTEQDKGDLRIEGVLDVASVGADGVSLRLRELIKAVPGPKLEALASSEGGKKGSTAGVGGGVVIGGIVGGPGGAFLGGVVGGFAGNAIGKRLGKREAAKRTREHVYDALVEGLALATEELRLPNEITLLPTSPAVVAGARWCQPLQVTPKAGLRAALSIAIVEDSRSALARRLAVSRGTNLEAVATIPAAFNASAELSQDLVNRLLAEWTVRGGFDTVLASAGLAGAIEAELGSKTRWKVRDIVVELPPVVDLRPDTIAASLGGITMRLVDDGRDEVRDVVLGGTGRLALEVNGGTTVRVGGSLDQAYFGCRLAAGPGRQLPACFSSAVDPELVRKKINVAIVVNTPRLPRIDLADLVALELAAATGTATRLEAAEVHIGDGVMRMDANLVAPAPELADRPVADPQ